MKFCVLVFLCAFAYQDRRKKNEKQGMRETGVDRGKFAMRESYLGIVLFRNCYPSSVANPTNTKDVCETETGRIEENTENKINVHFSC